jgi:ribosome-binding factor A
VRESSGHRHARLSQILREELDALLRDELTDPGLEGVFFVSCELSVDYRNARIGYGLDGDARDAPEARRRAERALERATGFMRARLVEALDTKRAPELRFVFDRDATREA